MEENKQIEKEVIEDENSALNADETDEKGGPIPNDPRHPTKP